LVIDSIIDLSFLAYSKGIVMIVFMLILSFLFLAMSFVMYYFQEEEIKRLKEIIEDNKKVIVFKDKHLDTLREANEQLVTTLKEYME
jgi:preprotein translocase subunit SecG